MLRHVSALAVGHLQGALIFLACASYGSSSKMCKNYQLALKYIQVDVIVNN